MTRAGMQAQGHGASPARCCQNENLGCILSTTLRTPFDSGPQDRVWLKKKPLVEPVMPASQRISLSAFLVLLLAACTGRPAPVYYQEAGLASKRPALAPVFIDNNIEVLRRGTYRVQGHESVYDIARTKRLNADAIIAANNLRPPYALTAGQELRLPGQRTYTVLKGDTLYGVANRLRVNARRLIDVNRLQPPYHLYAGQSLVLPGGTPVTQMAASGRTRGSAVTARPLSPVTSPAPKVAAAPLPAPAPLASGGQFLWPVEGRIVAGFGPQAKGQQNDGIKIAVPVGTPVRATQNGVVAYAGDAVKGYGNLILLKHANGWVSAYAHTSEFLVRRGATVQRGQVIAKSGQSGTVTSPQLHFELRRGKKAVDPLQYLQNRRVSQL
jgi:murein DD-endopeptidase MepM/ murein hydrolase activator NlpD